MRRTTALVIALLVAATPAAAGPESRGQNFPLSLPTPEVSLGSALPPTTAQDTAVAVWGTAAGELALLNLENRTLWARTSSDSGATFAAAVRVAGVPLESGIEDFAYVGTPSGDLYVAYLAADPGGDVGLYLRRSDDMGRTWTAPKPLVVRGDARHGILDLQIDADDSGHVTVVFDEAWELRDVWAMSSINGGDTWTPPVRLDQTDVAGAWEARLGDVHVGPGGVVHVAFLQDRGFGDRVWYARSTNNGASYSMEVKFDALVPGLAFSAEPDLVTARDGSLLLTFWDRTSAGTTNSLFFLRSTTSGASWTLSVEGPFPATGIPIPFRILPSRYTGGLDNDQVLLALNVGGELTVYGSGDNGEHFGWLEGFGSVTSVRAFDIGSTPEGEWVVVWEGTDQGIYASGSFGGGFGWSFDTRADQGVGAGAESLLGNVTVAGTNTIFTAYLDRRNDAQRQYDVYAADSPLVPVNPGMSFTGREKRVDTDDVAGNLLLGGNAAMVTDGPSRVYVGATAISSGPNQEVWFTRSEDAGRTFLPAVKVSTQDPAIFGAGPLFLAAQPGGLVYLLWESTNLAGTGPNLLLASRSVDFGATWSPAWLVDAVGGDHYESYALVATGSVVVAVWSETTEVLMSRSTNGGLSFGPPLPLSANSIPYNVAPKLCAQGSRIILVYEGENGFPGSGDVSPWARVSNDGGNTWTSRVELRSAGATGTSLGLDLACVPGTTAVAAWSDPRTGTFRTYASRFDGTFWSPDQPLGGPPGEQYYPDLAFAGANTWVTTFADQETQVFAGRSVDDGVTWAAPQRLDGPAPQPLAVRGDARIVSDGSGNVWVNWVDGSAGRFSSVVRHSADAGASWGELRRANRDTPQGGNGSGLPRIAALPGRGIVGWFGYRTSRELEFLVNVWDAVDIDGDGSPDATDCSDSPSTYPGAPEINDGQDNNCPGDPGAGIVDELSGTLQHRTGSNATGQICWPAQTGATQYELARSTSPDMTAGCFTVTTALKCHTDPTLPPPGQTFYYLVRATAPHVGSWGADGDGQERAVSCAP